MLPMKGLLALLMMALWTVSCTKEEVVDPNGVTVAEIEQFLGRSIDTPEDFPKYRELTDDEIETIIRYVANEGNYSEDGTQLLENRTNDNGIEIFEQAILRTRLVRLVINAEVTGFAPSNAAFEAFGVQNIIDLFNTDLNALRNILSYHVAEGKFFSTDLTTGFYPTLAGPALNIQVGSNGITVDGANVILADQFNPIFFNGVVHVIDQILFPPTQTIVDIAIESSTSATPEFTQLVAAVVQANLVGTLSGDGPFTVFAPTDAAFEDLYQALGVNGVDEIDNATLTAVLLYHVVPARVFSTDLSTGTVSTLGGDIFIDANALTIDDNGTAVDANLIPSLLDIQGSNGVIHVIDKVLLP